MKAPVTRKEAVEKINCMEECIQELKEIIVGAQAKEELLLDYIDNICGIIEAEMPLKEQDLWLADMKRLGIYPDRTYE